MVILSTSITEFKKELLSKFNPKVFKLLTIAAVLTKSKGREFEAMQVSHAAIQQLAMGAGAISSNADAVKKTKQCGNCGLHHPRHVPDLPHVLSVEAVDSKGTGRKCVLKLKRAHNPNGQYTSQYLSETSIQQRAGALAKGTHQDNTWSAGP